MNTNNNSHSKAGRPSMFSEDTKDISLRLPVSLLDWVEAESHPGVAMSFMLRNMLIEIAEQKGYSKVME